MKDESAVLPLPARPRERRSHGPLGPSVQGLAVGAVVVFFLVVHAAWLITVPGDLDSFNFALGARHFDVAQHRPHPPGAPVYIAGGKVAVWIWQGLGLPTDPLAGPEAAALAGVSLLAGALSIVLVWQVLTAFEGRTARTSRAVFLFGAAPLIWLQAARPLSDATGLVLVLATYLLLVRGWTGTGALFSGISIGLRVQAGLLTVPAVLIALVCRRSRLAAVAAAGSFTAGVLAWLVPLLVTSGGVTRYLAAVSAQVEDDLAGPVVLASAPTLRGAADALFDTFVRSWGAPALAIAILAAALAGAVRVYRASPRQAAVLALCATPYVAFHLAFQDTGTIRYALPVVLGVAYLAAAGVEVLPRRWHSAAAVLLVAGCFVVSVPAVRAYSREGSPAMRLLHAMHARAAVQPPAFVTGHAHLMLPQLQRVMASRPWQTTSPPPSYEWQSTASHWIAGGSAPVWFVADPQRTDSSLLDRRSRRVLGSFDLPASISWLLNGLRPKALTWWEVGPPAWMAVRGFALTPEVGGIAARDRHGPAFDGAVAMVRRSASGGVLAVGGRHVGAAGDPAVQVAIAVDGRTVRTVGASPQQRDYSALVHLRPHELAGDTPYATVTVRSTPVSTVDGVVPVSLEHFDYQPDEGVLLGLSTGWHEPELQPQSGQTWRWATRRAAVLVHRRPGTAVALRLSGDAPAARRVQSARIRVTSGGRVLDEFQSGPGFSRRIVIDSSAGDPCDVEILLESTFSFVPFEGGESGDRRELAFRIFEIAVDPLAPPK